MDLPTLIGGALLALFSAAAGSYLTRRHERGTRLEERRQRIYMMLLDLSQTHFWISSGDMPMPEREIRPEMKDRYWEGAWRIADELRAVDDLPQLPAVIDALFSLRFEHEWQRAEAISKVIDEMGRDVNPRFRQAMRRRDGESHELMARDSDEWFRRRGKIEPLILTPTQRARGRATPDQRDGDEEVPPA